MPSWPTKSSPQCFAATSGPGWAARSSNSMPQSLCRFEFQHGWNGMSHGTIKLFNEVKGFGFIKPADGGNDVFFHVTALREGDEITVGKAVTFEIGVDPKSGKSKAVSVDLV